MFELLERARLPYPHPQIPRRGLLPVRRGGRGTMARVRGFLLAWFGAAVLLTGGLARVHADTAPPSPPEVIRESVEGLRGALQAGDSSEVTQPEFVIPLIRRHVMPNLDVSLATRLILGNYWKSASVAQRAAFEAAFTDALLRTYATHAAMYIDARVEVLETEPVDAAGNVVRVRTEVSSPARPPAQVDYRMVRRDDGWKAFDAAVDGISFIKTYRAALREDIRRAGLDAVIESMRDAQRPLAAGRPQPAR